MVVVSDESRSLALNHVIILGLCVFSIAHRMMKTLYVVMTSGGMDGLPILPPLPPTMTPVKEDKATAISRHKMRFTV